MVLTRRTRAEAPRFGKAGVPYVFFTRPVVLSDLLGLWSV